MAVNDVFKPANAGAQSLEISMPYVQVMRIDLIAQVVKSLAALAEILFVGVEVEP